MHDEKTVQRFIELRSQGWSYARLAGELNVSKPTLIDWGRKYQFKLNNLKTVELEALGEKWLAGTHDRVNRLGEQLRKVETELTTRDVTELSTPQLHNLSRSLRRQIEQATGTGTATFTVPVSEIPGDEYHDQVLDWKS